MIWLVTLLTISLGAVLFLWYRQNRNTRTILGQMAVLRTEVEALREEKEHLAVANRITLSRYHRLETALRSIPDPLLITDSAERVVVSNSAAEKMFHFELPAGSQKALTDCVQEKNFFDILHSTRLAPTHKEVEVGHSNGQGHRWYNVLISPVQESQNDETRGLVALLRDVTRDKETAKMKTDFVANAAHELRTPLGGIKAYLEMLIDGEVPDNQTREKFYGVMQDEVNRLSNLIENILNISRIEAGIVKVSKEPIPLTAVVKEVLDIVRPKAEADGFTLKENLAPVFFHVRADREMIKQAVLNLLSNALKYTPKGGMVLVKMSIDEVAGKVTTEVSDSGVGISEEELPRMFNKFFRSSNSKKMAKGTGLGLALVKEIVETVHGGKITVSSILGKGSTFSFSLPLIEQQ